VLLLDKSLVEGFAGVFHLHNKIADADGAQDEKMTFFLNWKGHPCGSFQIMFQVCAHETIKQLHMPHNAIIC
jgi:hypothetical protein